MKYLLIAVLFSAGLLITSCAPKEKMNGSVSVNSETSSVQNTEYREITPEDAKAMIDEGGVTVVDVRTAGEYAEKHIPESLLLPLDTIGESPPAELPDFDAVLLVHCRTGVRSRKAVERLVRLGYTNVYDMGGIVNWPYDTVSDEEDEK